MRDNQDLKPPVPDGIALFYVKDGELYPVGLTETQAKMLPLVIRTLGKIKVFIDKPQGKVEDLIVKKGSDEK